MINEVVHLHLYFKIKDSLDGHSGADTAAKKSEMEAVEETTEHVI